jgi:UDP-N-acetylglucosamine--N-acetylmuramyl-(pentapeptide) pyrophosphoryl-undecaprenol N-acetylglucosamine transferase
LKEKTYIIAAGGTSGHINPAIAIADKIRKEEPCARILFCGTAKGIENTIVPASHYELAHIDAAGFPSRPTKQFFEAAAAFFAGRRQSRELLKKEKPDAVIGTGGYVCGPMVSMASSMGIPTLLHEQNAFPGKANRFLARHANVVCISFPGTRSAFAKSKKIVLTGNPVREVFFNLSKESARRELGIAEGEKIVFATGGSLGAKTINQAVMNLIKNHPAPDFRIILACGSLAYPGLVKEAAEYSPYLDLREYLFDQHLYIAAADLVLCRAGALTASEIAVTGKASIMVPYPYAAGDHQTFNARTFSDIGACILIADRDLDDRLLYEQLIALLSDPERITLMENRARTLAMPSATSLIYDELAEIVRESKKR